MEDFEDDFGELYAGVEAQAVSAINGVPDFAQYNTEPDEDINDKNNNAKNATPSSELGFVSDSKTPNSICEELDEKVSGLETNEDYSGSDSEDDLNIVLNDEDCKDIKFPIAGRGCMKNDEPQDEDDDDGFVAMKEYKYIRTQGSTCPSNVKPNESVGLVSSMLVRGDHDSSMCNQRKGSISQITCIRGKPSSVVAQNRYGFRLPWYRTILDVNIESFEEKPWRHPRVDMTDYFNFGFDEDSWKQYCSSLEQLRRGIPVSESSKYHQAKEAGSEYEKFTHETMSKEMNHAGSRKFASPSSKFTDCGVRQPKGKAIQIEDSTFERQPSFDMRRHPRNWDSDVVIQITVQDLTEETSNSGEEQGRTNNNAPEASENAEFDADGGRIIPSSNTAEEDDLLLGTLEGNIRLDRCSQQTSASHPLTIGSDNHGNDQIVDLDEYDHEGVNAIPLEAIEITNKTTESVGRNTFYADQCMMEAQLSLGDDCQLNPTSSCFASDSEASKNSSVHFDPEDIPTLARSSVNSHTELCESVTSSFKNSKGNAIKRKLVDIKDYSTCKSTAQKEHKHRDRRLDSVVKPKMHTKDDHDTEDLSDRDPMVNYRRQKERLQDFGCTDREDSSGYKKSKLSCHNGVRYADNHVQTVNRNYLNRKGSHKFQYKLDPHVIKTWNKRAYFCEDRDTVWHHFGRTQFIKERSPLTSRDSRGLYSRYSSYTVEERDTQWKRKSNKWEFKKIPNSGGCSDYNNEDHFVGEKFGGYFSSNDLKRNALDKVDERQFPHVRRELKNSGERVGYVESPISYLDDSYSGKTENEYCGHRENQYLSHQSDRELYTADEGRWSHSISPRNDVSYSRTTDERYWRHGRKIYSEESKENDWFDGHDDADGTEDTFYPNDHLRWRRSNCRSEVLHWTENQLTIKRHGDKLYSEKASFSSQKYARHEKFHAKYGSSRDELHIDDMRSEQQRLIRSVNCINRSSKMYRAKHEQTVLECRDSSDLGVGEGKSSGRCSKGRTLMCNGRLENMDPETGGERTTLMDSSESEKVRAVQFDTPKVGCNQNNEKGLDKFPVTAQNDDLEVEEGQILTEEPNTGYPLQRKHASEYAAQGHNVKKRMFDSENASNGNKVVEGCDNQRILETKAKMEKRWERFKEPITLKKEPDKWSKPEVDLIVETAETKQHRPARRRRWGGV